MQINLSNEMIAVVYDVLCRYHAQNPPIEKSFGDPPDYTVSSTDAQDLFEDMFKQSNRKFHVRLRTGGPK